MGFNTSRADQERLANQALRDKLTIEEKLSPKLTEIFEQINNDNRALFATTGNTIDAHLFDDEISAALKSAYVQGADLAGSRITSFIDDNRDDSLAQAIALLALANAVSFNDQLQSTRDRVQVSLRDFINNSVADSTLRIGNTTNDRIRSQIISTEQELIEDAVFPTNPQIATAAAATFAARIPGRVVTISMTEVQNAFEGASEIERTAVVEDLTLLEIRGEARTELVNRWVTRGDEKVRTPRRGARFNHVEADGQQRREREPFVVSGELLMYPGDSSLGASIGNTINCRCTLVPIVDVTINE